MKPRKFFIVFMLAALLVTPFALIHAQEATEAPEDVIVARPRQRVDMVLLPKFLGIAPFEQAYAGAQEAHLELANRGELTFLGPPPDNSIPGQIEIIEQSTEQGIDAIMISANSLTELIPATQAAIDAGMTVVTWDSPVAPEGEALFVAQVDFDETGKVMADMALSILGEDGGQFAILSASRAASNQNAWIAAMEEVLETDDAYANLELVATVYGDDNFEDSYLQALLLIEDYPDLELIMAPTTVGIVAAAQAMEDEERCDTVKVSGLGLPDEMISYVESGCAPEFALWSFTDLGYLTYYITYLLATGDLEGEVGETFEAGRMGVYTIEEDPTREGGKRVLMGPFTVYNAENIEDAVGGE